MNEKSNKIKKIPILTYLCYLLAVSVLFTGVTFSRYSASTSGDVSSSLVPYIASYEIDNISATTFPNSNYWLSESADRAVGTARTVRYTMRNYEAGADGSAQRVNELDLQGSVRLYVPAELAGSIALQLEEVQPDSTSTAVTPQYVLSELLAEVDSGSTTWNTAAEPEKNEQDYDDLSGAPDEVMNLSGSLNGKDGTLFAQAQGTDGESGNTLSITESVRTVQYSVGFQRGVPTQSTVEGISVITNLQPQLFLDLEKEELYYAVDITLPDEMLFEGGVAQQKTFVLYITLTHVVSSDDFGIDWTTGAEADQTCDAYLQKPAAGTGVYTFNGAKVLGYHFDVEAATYERDGAPRANSTTVRVTKAYGIDEAGTSYTGEATLSFLHVAPISEDAVNYVHPIQKFYTYENNAYTEADDAPATIQDAQNCYGVCTNLDGTDGEYYISFANMPDDPRYATYEGQETNAATNYAMGQLLSRNYPTRLTAIFVQASESSASGEVIV